MGKKRGHRQFKDFRYKLYHGDNPFLGYPHRRHNKNLTKNSEIRRIKEFDRIEILEEEISEIL